MIQAWSKSFFEPYEKRGTYKNKKEGFLAFLGYSVGIGNVWRFPYLCFKYGGVTFLIPYFVALATIGLPLCFLEMSLGQYVSIGPMQMFSYLCPLFSGVGWAMIFCSILETIYYNIVLAWTLFYIGASFSSPLPWCLDADHKITDCSQVKDHHMATEFYFNQTVFGEAWPKDNHTDEGAAGDENPIQGWFVLCLALAWYLIAMAISKGIKSSGKILYITVGVPYIILPFMLVFSFDTTEHTKWAESLRKYGSINNNTLVHTEIWNEAATQVLYSLGLAHGGITHLASYNSLRNNFLREVVLITFFDTATSVLCSLVVFSLLETYGQDLATGEQASTRLMFQLIPALLAKMDSRLWAVLFFFMIFFFGFDTQFVIVDMILTALFDQFQVLRRKYVPVVVAACTLFFLLGIPMCTRRGMSYFLFLHYNVTSHAFLFLGLVEVLVVCYVYGFNDLMRNVKDHMRLWVPLPLHWYFAVMCMVVTPLAMLALLTSSFYFRDWTVVDAEDVTGIVIAFSAFAIVGGGIVRALSKKGGEGWAGLLKATSDFCPEYIRREMTNTRHHYQLHDRPEVGPWTTEGGGSC
ncbi:sodium- and chloride-dependent neutral and basic amino acid transporter B(0+)-like [Penaeus japonicus]|uniref:sodium- and chloride-dependent neutral and basic amino acid transporter B(0+)-like n=1 Tax=Penaeus japonicus TaxID=27405 RepID=UPI001C7128A8|nr:sodium- and chloride-dependent neutral and basic amino acid transporter B(0+)-like [Penaeus japonicus]